VQADFVGVVGERQVPTVYQQVENPMREDGQSQKKCGDGSVPADSSGKYNRMYRGQGKGRIVPPLQALPLLECPACCSERSLDMATAPSRSASSQTSLVRESEEIMTQWNGMVLPRIVEVIEPGTST
jgi:hypothetical protein